jgi:DNA-binding transcriptional ArsR family regulator
MFHFHYSGNMDQVAAVAKLGALAQENRIAIFRLLVEAGPAGRPAGAIGERLGLPGPTLSFHLAQLKQAGLVVCRREGRSLIYAADYAAMNALLAFLTENCCAGSGCAAPASSTRSQETRHATAARARRRSSA